MKEISDLTEKFFEIEANYDICIVDIIKKYQMFCAEETKPYCYDEEILKKTEEYCEKVFGRRK